MLQASQDAPVREGQGGVRERPGKESVYAALDLGTNNCRLLIASPQTIPSNQGAMPPLKVYDSFSRIVRLGEGVTATGTLSPDAMERTIIALKACQKKLAKYSITASRFVATEACRRASNGAEFIQRAHDEAGLSIDIISSEEEARLAFMGCSSLLTEASSRAIVFDVGGGSTELMWIEVEKASRGAHRIVDWLSVGYGVMNLADKFGGSNLADLAFNDMVKLLAEQLKPFNDKNGIGATLGDSKVQLLSTSGTVTTLAAIHLGLPRYDRSKIDGITLPVAAIRDTTQKLLKMRPSERFHHPCIGSDRADFILSGCAIFEAISSMWPTADITIADRGVREGIILSLMNNK